MVDKELFNNRDRDEFLNDLFSDFELDKPSERLKSGIMDRVLSCWIEQRFQLNARVLKKHNWLWRVLAFVGVIAAFWIDLSLGGALLGSQYFSGIEHVLVGVVGSIKVIPLFVLAVLVAVAGLLLLDRKWGHPIGR